MKRITALFGDAQLMCVLPDSPDILDCLRASSDPNNTAGAEPVLTVRCGPQATALVMTDSSVSPTVLRNPVLRGALRTSWSERWIFWVRITGPVPEEALLRNGVQVVRSGLIPVGGGQQRFSTRVDHEGPILEITSLDVDVERADDRVFEPQEVTNHPPDGVESASTQTNASNSEQAATTVDDLRLVFAEHAVREVSANDQRFARELLPSANVETEFPSAWPDGPFQLLGVECGKVGSRHLVALLFRKSQAWAEFLRSNPRLRDGLITAWPSAVILWLRIEGHVPRNLNAGPLTWFSQGIIPVAVQGKLLNEYVVQKGPIPAIQFSDIAWEAKTKDGFGADEIAQIFGPPFLPKRPRKFVFNELFCSEMFLRKLEVLYDSSKQSFQRFDNAVGEWVQLSREKLTQLVANGLVQISRDFPDLFPPSEIRRSRVSQIVWLMETRAAAEVPPEQAVERFFVQGVEACPDESLTSAHLFEGFRKFCLVRRLPVCSKAYFDRQAAKRFGDTSHCFGPYRTERGRSGWRLKLDVILDPFLGQAG